MIRFILQQIRIKTEAGITMKTIRTDEFEKEVLKAKSPVLLEFYSDSCIPCKKMSPLLAELDEEYKDITFLKFNINFGQEVTEKYEVMASPTILLFKNGKELDRIRGAAKKADIEKLLGEAWKQ